MIIAASDAERRDLFLETAVRLGTAIQNVEKDFWVCWVLDMLFNGLHSGGPRLLFKGGTSLSKAFGLISRFSEDIDITVFRDDLGTAANVADMDALNGRKRRARLNEIRDASRAYIGGPLFDQLSRIAAEKIPKNKFRLELDPEDMDGQTILFWYPSVTATTTEYIRSAVKIEAGAKSALDPHVMATVTPYVAKEMPDLNMIVTNITTIKPERTFWDKIIILHGLRQWHDRRGVLRHGGQRVSRHYYDVHQLMQASPAIDWPLDRALAIDCAHHARLFFGSPDLGLEAAATGSLTLTPGTDMRAALAKDFQAMAGMVFGKLPEFDEVLATVERLERAVNELALGECRV